MTADEFDDWPCSWCGDRFADHLDAPSGALCLETPGTYYEPRFDWDPTTNTLKGH